MTPEALRLAAELRDELDRRAKPSGLAAHEGSNCIVLIGDGLAIRAGLSANLDVETEICCWEEACRLGVVAPVVLDVGVTPCGARFQIYVPVAGRRADTTEDWEAAGRALGVLHADGEPQIAGDRPYSVPRRARRAELAQGWASNDEALEGVVRASLHRAQAAVVEAAAVFCHGDFREPNLRIQNDNTVGAFDWSDARARPREADFAGIEAGSLPAVLRGYRSTCDRSPSLALVASFGVERLAALEQCDVIPRNSVANYVQCISSTLGVVLTP